jgi:hypothetical protein
MTRARKAIAGKTQRRRKNYSAAMLDTLIDEATVDAYDDSEQKAGFFTMLENHLATPFATEVLGMIVMVEAVDMTDDEEIVAMCVRDKWRQPIRIIELPLPDPPPEGRSGSRRIVDGRAGDSRGTEATERGRPGQVTVELASATVKRLVSFGTWSCARGAAEGADAACGLALR